jgi:hypothetical protein
MSYHYNNRAIQEFLETDLADPWLVAFAMSNNWTIATYKKTSRIDKTELKSLKFVTNLM